MQIYPVINQVPTYSYVFDRKCKLSFVRLFARKSVRLSSRKSGLLIDKLRKDRDGVPLKSLGNSWSVTHKVKYVGGVFTSRPIGIDIEEISLRSDMLYEKIASSYEWSLGEGDREKLFFRYWTAKEAVLKAEHIGLLGLSNCFIEEVVDDNNIIVRYDSKIWYVESLFFDKHIASIAFSNHAHIEWSIE